MKVHVIPFSKLESLKTKQRRGGGNRIESGFKGQLSSESPHNLRILISYCEGMLVKFIKSWQKMGNLWDLSLN